MVNALPSSQTMSTIQYKYNDLTITEGSTILPAEAATLPIDCKDLLIRLLEFKPERRIRSIFALQRIAFFMNFNFDDVRKRKVNFWNFFKDSRVSFSEVCNCNR